MHVLSFAKNRSTFSHGIRYFTHAPCRKLLPWWTHTSGAEIGVRRKRDGLDVPVWMCPRSAIDLDRIQSPSANSKPFANAASLVIFFVWSNWMRKGYSLQEMR